MSPDFDRVLDRRGTNSLKWDFQERFTGLAPADVPMVTEGDE